ncbi:MAG: hypothetical protein J0G96_02855 [Flavobacteriia bacterium]|nr:hypothetical protein [Flavobacteriia bacterium]OJX35235.1 MAG: hypothetical protein BGO87_10125 [Flavobacteriia bacterium 40-80]
MSNDKIDTRKEKYFAGTSSAEEEKWLKEHSGDPFFKALKEEQEEKMDWEFDDFLAIAGVQKVTGKSFRISFRKIGYWSAAAVFLIVFGTILLTRHKQEKTLIAKQNKVTEQKTKKQLPEVKEETPVIVLTEQKEEPAKRVKTHPAQKQQPSFPEEITAYYPEYVVINGKPVYDLEEAKELTKNSLALLATNVEKSVSEMEHIKHLSVKF